MIEVNQDPKDRMAAPAKYFKNEILEVFNEYLTEIPAPIIDLFEATYWIWYFTNFEKWQEIQGIVAAVDNKDLSMSKAVLVNALYEIEAWCTSIIAKQSDGSIIHARNLDFENPNGMRKVTYRATCVKDGEYLSDAVMFAGNCGVYTGIKSGAYSISENERFP